MREAPHVMVLHIAISPDSVFLGVCATDTIDGLKICSIMTGGLILKIRSVSCWMAFLLGWIKSLCVASQLTDGVIQI
ncbi:hypothetical protein V8C42DRAFT_163768 [Trichoderma barbatum]